MPITAISADGVNHEFPDGTPDAVIDRAMAQYARSAAKPSGRPVNPRALGDVQKQEQGRIAEDLRRGYKSVEAAQRDEDRSRALINGYSFGFADELRSAGNAFATGVQNLVGKGRGYSAREAYDASQAFEASRRAEYQRQHPVESRANDIGGAVANPLNLVGGEWISAARGAPQVARAAAVGGAFGGVAGTGNSAPGQRVTGAAAGAGFGAVTGGALQGAGNAFARSGAQAAQRAVVNPTPARVLSREGVQLTPGQMLGGGAKAAEDLAMRAPIVGTAIRGARRRGVESLNRSVANRALQPIGETLPDNITTGNEAVDYVAERIGAQYDRAARLVPSATPDQALTQELAAIRTTAGELPPDIGAQFTRIIENRVTPRLAQPLDGQTIRQMQSELGSLASQYRTSADAGQRQLAAHLDQVSEAFGNLMGRTSPEAAAVVARANEGWANYARLRNAASRATDGVFTPGQLKGAVRSSDRSVGKGNVARGRALMQDLSNPASAVLPDSFGNPGTADAQSAMGLVGLSVFKPYVGLPTAAGVGLAAGAYSEPAQRLLNAIYRASNPGQARAALGRLAQLAAQNPAVYAAALEEARAQLQGGPASVRSGSQLLPQQIPLPQ